MTLSQASNGSFVKNWQVGFPMCNIITVLVSVNLYALGAQLSESWACGGTEGWLKIVAKAKFTWRCLGPWQCRKTPC